MINKLNDFIIHITNNPIELYNEFQLQFELALFLKNKYPDLIIKPEYPARKIFPDNSFIKSDIDLFIQDGNERYAIELKMPKNDGGTPKAMYNTVKDVKFLEELNQAGLTSCYSIIVTNNPSFWEVNNQNPDIYSLFNGNSVNIRSITYKDLPSFLQNKKSDINLRKIYSGDWQILYDNWRYCIIEV